MIAKVYPALFSHWLRHPLQLITLLTGLALATALWSAVQAINTEARTSYAQAERRLNFALNDRLEPRGSKLTIQDYAALRRDGLLVSPVIQGQLRLGSVSFEIMGVDPLSHPIAKEISNVTTPGGEPTNNLALLMHPGPIVMHPQTYMDYKSNPSLPPALLSLEVPPGLLLADIATAADLLGQTLELDHLILLPDQPLGVSVADHMPAHLQHVKAPKDRQDGSGMMESFHLNLTAFGFLSFAVGLFIVQGAVALAMEQRREMLRTLRCLGVPFALLLGLLAIEVLVLALFAGSIGLILGYVIAALLLPGVSATLVGLFGVAGPDVLSFRLDWVVSGLFMAVFGASLASAQSFYALRNLPISQPPSIKARSQRAGGHFGRIAAVAPLLILIGVVYYAMVGGLIAGFVLLAGLMLGAALLWPFLLDRLVQLARRLPLSPLATWLLADTRAQLPAMSLALMALLLALATNIGVGTMVSSFRLTFQDWMQQRLSAEIYITARDEGQGHQLEEWLAQQAVRVLPIRSTQISFAGQPLKIYGVIDDQTYRSNWPMLAAVPHVWDRIAASEGLLINEQLARRLGLWTGDLLLLEGRWPRQILGVYSDYGNPNAQAIVSMQALLASAPQVENSSFGIRLPPENVNDLVNSANQAFDFSLESVIDQDTLRRRSLLVFDKTFLITASLNLLTLGVASFAILTSLLTNWTQRLPQLAPVWAMGVERRHLALLDLIRSVIYAAMTALFALPLGLLLAWILLAIINVEAFGWRLPMFLFPLDWLRLFALALLAAVLAAALPAWRLARLQPNSLLEVFANER